MIKHLLSLVLFSLFASRSFAGPLVNFKVSRTVCLLSFMETVSGDPHSSSTLKDYIMKAISPDDTSDLMELTRKFASLDLDHTYVLDHYPAQRQKPRSSMNLIKIAAVQSESLPEFFSAITGILPNEQLLLFKEILSKAEYYYDEIILKNNKVAFEKQFSELKLYNYKTKNAFLKVKTFYGSTWPDTQPFTVAVYPIPGRSGHTTATPHSHSVIMGMLTEEKDYESRMGVAVHEICHVLYEEQPLALQWKLDSVFTGSSSLSAAYAYNYLDEALATACGNGWMYELLTGSTDKNAWYNDEYINTYAHALYPMVKEYIENLRTIDRRFIVNAIKTFEQQFPDAAYEYANLFNKMNFYTDAGNAEQYHAIMNTLNRYYRIYSCSSSYPITDPQSLAMAGRNVGTQLFIVHTKKKENFDALRRIFPELNKADENEESIISFIDGNNRPVVIINVNTTAGIEPALKKMAETKKISAGLSSVSLN